MKLYSPLSPCHVSHIGVHGILEKLGLPHDHCWPPPGLANLVLGCFIILLELLLFAVVLKLIPKSVSHPLFAATSDIQ